MSLFSRLTCSIFHVSNCKYSVITSNRIKPRLFKGKSYLLQYLFKSSYPRNGAKIGIEQESLENNKNDNKSQFLSFHKMVDNRRDEAQRSILVQVHSEQSCTELHAYCSQFGDVKGLHHYSLPESLHFILVEFQTKNDVKNILDVCNHVNKQQIVPIQSPLLWFRAKDKSKIRKLITNNVRTEDSPPLVEQFGNTTPSSSEVRNWLLSAESFSDQILILHRTTQLSDLGVRLRFLTARQIELALSGLFPLAKALPFGSSINGYGKVGCDLDLVLQLDEDESKDDDDCRLVFHAKTSLANGRTQVQRHMEAFGDICQLFLPGCSQVRRILQARVPIIKYKHDLMDVECDLSMTNMCAVHMGELLYLFGSCDERVRPLVFAVRCWALKVDLTNPSPGRWITNFSLSLMVLFYLQNACILPTLNTLISAARVEDRRITSEGVNCTFLRDISILKQEHTNTDNLEKLLFNFFEFYSSFDFGSKGISLADGVPILKPEHAALYITNPLERGLNVSKNVSMEEIERLRIELRNAAWCLESKMDSSPDKNEPWGLVTLLETPSTAAKGRNVFHAAAKSSGARLMNVQELFSEDIILEENSSPTKQTISNSVLHVGRKTVDTKNRKKKLNPLLQLQQGVDQSGSTKQSSNLRNRRKR